MAQSIHKQDGSLGQRPILKDIFMAGVHAVAPDTALRTYVRLEKDTLVVADKAYALTGKRLFVLGAGKGVAPMALAVEELLGERIYTGACVTKYEHTLPLTHIRLFEAAHPVPDACGIDATRALLGLGAQTHADDIVLCLITGGASALTPAPVPGVSLEDLQATTNVLMQCGATIHELNAIRKHLSLWSGGQLARVLAPAEVCTLVVSDVVGDDLSVIASGPTAPDPSTFADCLRCVEHYGIKGHLPQSVCSYLEAGLSGKVAETPKAGDPLFARVQTKIIASNEQALASAAQKAQELGYTPLILTSTMTGEARERAAELVAFAKDKAKETKTPLCLLAGGETTVTIRGTGRGGRNQEMALAAAILLEDEARISALFAGTDGTDGPTDAAGGFAHAETVKLLHAAGLEAKTLLANNDSYAALNVSGDLLCTGPTRTNVMDMAILLIDPQKG